jgi:hypothetical protein
MLSVEYNQASGYTEVKYSSVRSDGTLSRPKINADGTPTIKDKKIVMENVNEPCENKAYIYYMKPSHCGGNYSVSTLQSKAVDKGYKKVDFFTINYNANEFPSVPKFMKIRE